LPFPAVSRTSSRRSLQVRVKSEEGHAPLPVYSVWPISDDRAAFCIVN
jgi:hypothetical protein